MRFYLAPMEGITGYVFRNAYAQCYHDIDCYFTPFIGNKKMSARERRDVLAENNKAAPLVPQILTNRAEDFLLISRSLHNLGYDTVNLNLGCPSGTVAARGRGAGFLAHPQELDAFLYEIFERSPLRISIKTRIGVSGAEEWGPLLEIYKKYPLAELIIHPRLQTDFYKNRPRREAYALAMECLTVPLCYNGDIVSVKDYQELVEELPDTASVMIGRGILRRPWLVGQIRERKGADRKTLITFHELLAAGYLEEMQGERDALFRLKELWSYLGDGFAGADKPLKRIRKSRTFREYRAAADEILHCCELAGEQSAGDIAYGSP